VSVDRDAAQITLRRHPTGAGGGASLTPALGVEMVFDRIGGWLSCVVVEAGEPGGAAAVGEEAVAYLASVFGRWTAHAILEAPTDEVRCLALQTRPRAIGPLSRLARLDAARATSPVPTSPLWAAEAADLVRQANLPGRGEARQASVVVADGLGSAIPAEVFLPSPAVVGSGPLVAPGLLDGWLDPGLVPDGVFRPGLWPGSDLRVRAHWDASPLLAVEAVVLADAAPQALAQCRARLVDADARRILASAAFRAGAPSRAGAALRARAELPALVGFGEAWVEVVGDERRPTYGTRLRWMRRALRWADAALRAESRPNGLAPELSDEQWTRLAGQAWDRCRADWEAVGDPDRAGLAAERGTALLGALGGAPRSAILPKGLAGSAAVRRPRPFLAELVCDPAVIG
jgi:hypothetical protein